jgi:putative ABC transport system substrate-binding protein
MGKLAGKFLSISIFLSTVYSAHGNPVLGNLAEALSPSNRILSQRRQPSNFHAILSQKKYFSFVSKKDPTEADRPTTDSNGDKVLQSPEENKPQVIKVLMILWHGETDAERGFLTELKAMGYQVTPTVINVDRNLKRLKQILLFEINYEDYDCIYTFGTRVALVTSEYVHNKIPIIFNAVSYPIKAGLEERGGNRNNEGNFSGVGISAPMFIQFENMQKILKVKHLAVLVNPREQNCLNTLSMIEEVAPSFGINFECFDVTSGKEFLPALAKIKSAPIPFDAIYVPSGSPFTENSETIFKFGYEEKIAMIGEKEDMIRNGALMGTVAPYEQTGKLAAKIVDIHRRYRIAVAHIPIQYPEFYCIINQKVAEILGIHPDPKKINFHWFIPRE